MFFGMFISRGVRKALLHLENRIAASEVIQILRIVCDDISSPVNETVHSTVCKYTVKERRKWSDALV